MARSRLNLDMFEKRWTVYEGVRKLIWQSTRRPKIEEIDLQAFGETTKGACWLFDEAFADYLHQDIFTRAVDIQTDAAELETGSQLSAQDKKELRDRINGLRVTLREEMKLLDGRVAKFMQIAQ